MHLLKRIGNWCRRFRHRCGYGVHSPSDFFLITSVIYEAGEYYAYRSLRDSAPPASLPHYRGKVNRLLFRLVNHFRPATLLEAGTGNGDALRYMRAARPSMRAVSVEADASGLSVRPDRLKGKTVDFLHIGFTPYYKEVFEAVFPLLHPGSCVVVGGIYDSPEKQAWWKELQADERVRISFDLYDIGILLFEEKRFKQNYIVNFF